jgi:hypothetical protein
VCHIFRALLFTTIIAFVILVELTAIDIAAVFYLFTSQSVAYDSLVPPQILTGRCRDRAAPELLICRRRRLALRKCLFRWNNILMVPSPVVWRVLLQTWGIWWSALEGGWGTVRNGRGSSALYLQALLRRLRRQTTACALNA